MLAYQVKMLRDRIENERVYTKSEELAELLRLGSLFNQYITDVMLVVKPGTYRSLLMPKETKLQRRGRPRIAKATIDAALRFALKPLDGETKGCMVS